MMLKAVTLFLIAMLVLGMFGKLRFPKRPQLKSMSKPKKCKHCGGFIVDDGPCPCRERT